MQSCLVIKTSSLGDVLQTLPTVLALKKNFPHSKITWVVDKKCASILALFPQIDECLVVDFRMWRQKPFSSIRQMLAFIKALRSNRFDIALDFQANTKSAFIFGLAKALRKRSFRSPSEWCHRFIMCQRIDPDKESFNTYYRSLLNDLVFDFSYDLPQIEPSTFVPRDKKVVTLGLGSMWPSKKLNRNQIKELIESLKECYLIIPALQSEKEVFEKLLKGYSGNVLVLPSLTDYLPYLKASDLFIGVDSALLHLARLFKIPSQAYFGPSSSVFYGDHKDVQGCCPYNQKFDKRCPKLRSCQAPCMQSIEFKKS
jgi:heptosyltransferase I